MFHYFAKMDPGQGFEPRLTGPEPVVLPLDDPGTITIIYYTTFRYILSSPFRCCGKIIFGIICRNIINVEILSAI